MIRSMRWLLPAVLVVSGAAHGAIAPDVARKMYSEAIPSLVAVQYSWQNEFNKQEFIASGIVVGEDLVMTSIGIVNPQIPDDQMKDFKIVVPKEEGDPDEIEAVFQGRDERTNMALIKAKKPQHWKPIKFEEATAQVGDPVVSVGILPQAAAYKPYLMESIIAASLRGDVPQVLVQGGGLAAMGSPVYNADGKAIGVVSFSPGQSILLNNGAEALAAISNPPKFFVPASDFLMTLQDPPTPEKPILLPWIGVPQLSGLNKDVAEALGLKNQPAIQIGEVIPGTPGDKAGLKQGDIILKLNGKVLERGDEAAELPGILRRRLLRFKVGETVTLSVLREQDKPLQDIKIVLEEQPKRSNTAKRYFAEDLGFVVRELVFQDTYVRKLPADQKGVIVAMQRPQSASQSAGLQGNDLITRLNNNPVTDIAEFEKLYKATRKDKPHEALVLVVRRKTGEDTIRIEPPQ
ncbi:MAG: serine peptidase [Phycisphaerales bacterium]|nr:serine peptidase [Phycisphaerales bacterium]MDB5299915.1 serine peptidase [Phycisphaerales bacterium]MDB5304281.1 serine peptidase [Phycisphaerales bacterium]